MVTELCHSAGPSVDSFSKLMMCDYGNRGPKISTLDGKLVSKIEGQHTGFERTWSVAVSPIGQLFITDTEKHCVHVFQ